MSDHHSQNRALVRFVLLPLMFLTVALLGGLRVSLPEHAFVFIAPPLIALVLAVLLMLLFWRGHVVRFEKWIANDQPVLVNISHALTIFALFFASAQAFNSVLPERGLLHWLFSFFFLWTLWNNQFSSFDARRLLRSLAALFGTAFVLKHLLLSSLYAPEGGWLKRLAVALLEGASLTTLDAPAFAPATGYISFFTLALFVIGLLLLAPAPEIELHHADARALVRAYRELSEGEQLRAREAIALGGLTSSREKNREQQRLSSSMDDTEDASIETADEITIAQNPRSS